MAPPKALRGVFNKVIQNLDQDSMKILGAIQDTANKIKTDIKQSKEKKRRNKGYSKNQIDIGGQQTSVVKFNNARGSYNFNSNASEFVVERTEPVLAVVASATAGEYRAQEIRVLPMGPFRWLGNMANAFTSYQILRMEVTYIPSVPTTTAGAVSLSFQEDYRDDSPVNIEDMLLSEQALYSPVYGGTDGGRYLQQFGSPEGNVVSFELPKHTYTIGNGVARSFKITTNANFNTLVGGEEYAVATTREFSPGRVWVGTKGATVANQSLGQIFIRYKIKLFGAIAFGLQQ